MGDYASSVFINCPFDGQYQPLLDAMVFTVCCCDFLPRCALEIRLKEHDQTRLDKIFRIIEECRFGIHDLSRTNLDPVTSFPRFNMPLELGMFLGVKQGGRGRQRKKVWLALDSGKYNYHKFISDLSGTDIPSHGDDPHQLIAVVRDWPNDFSKSSLPAPKYIQKWFDEFRGYFPLLCKDLKQQPGQLTFKDQVSITQIYLNEMRALDLLD